jgi:hypothetical protein
MSSVYLRMAVAIVAIAVAICLAGYPMLVFGDGKLVLLVDALGAGALLSLLLPLLWRGHGTWLTLLLLGAEYVLVESRGDATTVSIPVYAAGLIGLCELLFWLAELPAAIAIDTVAIGRRLLSLALIGVAAASLALVTLLATYLQLSSASGAIALGGLAAAALLVIPLLLLHRRDWSE